MSELKILIADDEIDIRNLLMEQLGAKDYEVFAASNGVEAFKLFQEKQPDLALLDIMMPMMDGMTLLSKIRETSDMPVIFISARGEEYDRVLGLTQGADGYLVKPFSQRELLAHIEVQKRHIMKLKAVEETLKVGDLELDFSKAIVRKKGTELSLNAKEYTLLKYLVENRGKILTKKQIYEAVWNEEYMRDDNTIMVQLSHLRAKIDDEKHKYIETMINIGYRFVAYDQE